MPSVAGSRQIVFAPPRAATCATISRRKSTTDASRNARTSGVSSPGSGAAEALGAVVAAAASSAPRRRRRRARGTTQAGSSQKTESTPASSAAVGPLLAERAVGRAVQARGGDAAAVVEHLALLGMEGDPAALRLAAERPAEPPRAHLHGEAGVVRRRDDLGDRPAVVREVVLGERVQHAGVAARGEVGHVATYVAHDANAEVRAAGQPTSRAVEGHADILSYRARGQYHLCLHRAGGQPEGDPPLDEQEEDRRPGSRSSVDAGHQRAPVGVPARAEEVREPDRDRLLAPGR